jgi:hypothetical protein
MRAAPAADAPEGPSVAVPAEPRLLFRPDAFFLKPWRGWGVVRDRRGRPVARYEGSGHGRSGSRSATTEQAFTFEDGTIHLVEWEILSDEQDHFYARDLRSGIEARGEQRGLDFSWTFHTRAPTPFGTRRVRSDALYTMVRPSAAFSFTRVSWLGLTMTTYTTFYEHV